MSKYFLLLCVFSLSACVGVPVKRSFEPTAIINANGGVVAVELVTNADSLSSTNKQWTSIILVRLDNLEQKKLQAIDDAALKGRSPERAKVRPDVYSLKPKQNALLSSQVFIGTLPKGEYLIAKLVSTVFIGNRVSTVEMPVNNMAGRFKVDNSRLTDLGTLVFQPLMNIHDINFWLGGEGLQKAYVARADGTQKLDAFVRATYPNLPALFNDHALSWEPDNADPIRRNLVSLSRLNAEITDSIALAIHGRGLAFGRMGTVKWIDQNDRWQTILLPMLSTPLSAVETDSAVYIGAEQGALYKLNGPSAIPQISHPVNANEAIVWLARAKNNFFALTLKGSNYSAYSFQDPEKNWLKIGEFSSAEHQSNTAAVIGHNPERSYADAVTAIIDQSNQLVVYDKGNKLRYLGQPFSWSTPEPSKYFRSIVRLSEGTLVAAETSEHLADKLTLSFDDGKSWVNLSADINFYPSKNSGLPFASGNEFYIPGRNDGQGVVSDKLQLLVSSGKRNSRELWLSNGSMPDKCDRLLPQISRRDRIYCEREQGDLYISRNQGKTWENLWKADIAAMTLEAEKMSAVKAVENY